MNHIIDCGFGICGLFIIRFINCVQIKDFFMPI